MFCILFAGVVEDIFKIGSMAPGAMLYEASREFQVEYFLCYFLFKQKEPNLLNVILKVFKIKNTVNMADIINTG